MSHSVSRQVHPAGGRVDRLKDGKGESMDANYDSGCWSMEHTPSLNYSSDLKASSESQHSSTLSSDTHDSGFHSSGHKSLEDIPENPPTLSFVQVFQLLINDKPDPFTWNGKEDIKIRMSAEERARALHELWDSKGDADGDFEVINAAREGDDNVVIFGMYLADGYKRLNTKNLDGQTVLHVAAELCDARTVRMLISRGADGAIADLWGNTPLHIAARVGRADVIVALTTTLTKPELVHPLYKVPYKSLPQDNKDQLNHDGKAPIHLAAQNSYTDCIMVLGHAGVDMDSRRLGDGYAPAHITIDNNDFEATEACLKCDADMEVRNHKGETPQQLAYLIHRDDMVNLCQQFGASPKQLLYAESEPILFSDDEMDYDMDDLTEDVDDMNL